MSNIQVQLRRGTTTQHGSFTGAQGELTVDTDKNALVLHDGATAGGIQIARESVVNVLDYGVKNDGTEPSGDSNAVRIQNAVNAGNKISFPEGTYSINGSISFNSDNVEVDFGNAVLINAIIGNGCLFNFGVTSDTPLRKNLIIKGGVFEQSDPSGVYNKTYLTIKGTAYFKIDGCHFKNVGNGGITVEAGCENGTIENVSINGQNGYSTTRGIWLNGSTASDYVSQLVDTTSITRNASPVPTYAIKNVTISSCNIYAVEYGIYNMNTRQTKIIGCNIELVLGARNRCIALNNYSPDAIVTNCVLTSDGSATAILVTQASDNVLISNNVFKGDFGGNRSIYVQYLAKASIQGNSFEETATQNIQVNMGGYAVVKDNLFLRKSYTQDERAVYATAIDPTLTGGTVGSTATVLSDSGVLFTGNILKNVNIGINADMSLASSGSNTPSLERSAMRNNIFYGYDSAGPNEFPMVVSTGSSGNLLAVRLSENVLFPSTSGVSIKNRISFASGTDYDNERSNQYISKFRVKVSSSGTVIDISGGGSNHSLTATLSGTDLILAPRLSDNSTGYLHPLSFINIVSPSFSLGLSNPTTITTFQCRKEAAGTYTVTALNAAGSVLPFNSATQDYAFYIAFGPESYD